MKTVFFSFCVLMCLGGSAQNFSTAIGTAKTAYSAGKLEDAHFALQQAMQEIDMIIGKQVLTLLPSKLDTYTANSKDDNVTSNVGFIGTTIHRSYGTDDNVDLSIIGNSPLVTTLSALVNTPLIGGMMSNGNNKIVKVQGYKGQLMKDDAGSGQLTYTLQIPLGSSLITFVGKNTTDSQMMTWANAIPFGQIAKLVQ